MTWILRWDSRNAQKPELLGLSDIASSTETFYRDPDTGAFVVLDGCLFREDLTAAERASSPAEAVFRAYCRWGEACFDRLRGNFALVIWDHQQGKLIVGRDATGVNTCFYAWENEVILISTTLDCLLQQPEVSGDFNRQVIAEYLQGSFTPPQVHETFYADIRRLPPAHLLVLMGGTLRLDRYWDPLPPGFSWAGEAEMSTLEKVLERAVQRCLSAGADCLGLSGGFDSVSIAILAAEQLKQDSPLHALSLSFAGTESDEKVTQTRVAVALGMPQMIRAVDESIGGLSPIRSALELSKSSPSPVLSIWQSMYTGLLRMAADRGLHFLMMGTGGDEIFTVDPNYAADCLAQGDIAGWWRFYRMWQRSSSLSLLVVMRQLFWHHGLKLQLMRQARAVAYRLLSSEQLDRLRQRRRPVRSWISRDDPLLIEALYCRRTQAVELAPGEGAYVRTIRNLPQAPLLLLELDQAIAWARALGFTLLYPFFDRDLCDLCLRIHPEDLMAGGWSKAPLRNLVSTRLPSVTMPARKVDFTRTAGQVLRSDGLHVWNEMKHDLRLADLKIIDSDGTIDFMERYFSRQHSRDHLVWLILSTEMWLRARVS